jgi:hypothetical protein
MAEDRPPEPQSSQPSPAVDWSLWRHIEAAELWKVVAVSLGQNPDYIELGRKRTREAARDYYHRLMQAGSALGIGLKPVKMDPQKRCSPVRLVDFAAWFLGMKPPLLPPLPDEFPRPAPDRRTAADKPLRTRERDTLLKIILALAKAHNIPLDDPWSAAQRIEDLTRKAGHRVAARTIAGHLKKTANLIEDSKD